MFEKVCELEGFSLLRVNGDGVVLHGRGTVGLFTHDLRTRVWSQPCIDLFDAVDDGTSLWLGPADGIVRRLDYRSGQELIRFRVERDLGSPSSIARGVLLLNFVDEFLAVEHRGQVLWRRRRYPRGPAVVAAGDAFLIGEDVGQRLVCINAADGTERWRCEMVPYGVTGDAARAYRLGSGYPSVTCWGERLIVVRQFRDVLVLDLQSGLSVAHADTGFPGQYLVTDRHIYFQQNFALMTFDHVRMAEVDRISYEEEVRPLYRGAPPMVRGFTVTENAVIWTVPEGVLMGVSRTPGADGRRATWRADVGGLSPISVGPVVWGDYLYWNRAVLPPEHPAVLCFRGAHAND